MSDRSQNQIPDHIRAALSLFPPRPVKSKRADQQRVQFRSIIYLLIAILIFPLWFWSIDRKIDQANRRRAEIRASWATAVAPPAGPGLISGPLLEAASSDSPAAPGHPTPPQPPAPTPPPTPGPEQAPPPTPIPAPILEISVHPSPTPPLRSWCPSPIRPSPPPILPPLPLP